MYDEERTRKNFIDGLIYLNKTMKFRTEKDLKDYFWKKKDFYSLDIISNEEYINPRFLKDCIFVD